MRRMIKPHQLETKSITEALMRREKFTELAASFGAGADKALGIQTSYDDKLERWKTEVVVLQHGEVLHSFPMSKAGIATGVREYNKLP